MLGFDMRDTLVGHSVVYEFDVEVLEPINAYSHNGFSDMTMLGFC